MGRWKERSIILACEEREQQRSKKNKKKWVDGVNQRANKKQRVVATALKDVLDSECEEKEIDLCSRILTFNDDIGFNHLLIQYFTTNSVFARGFDLILQTTVDVDFDYLEQYKKRDNFVVSIDYKGIMRIVDYEFYAVTKGNKIAQELAESLNAVDLLRDRILYLEAIDVRVQYDNRLKKCMIGIATGKGSTVWSLIPPVLMLTPFEKTDAFQMIEAFKIIVHVIKSIEKEYIQEQSNRTHIPHVENGESTN